MLLHHYRMGHPAFSTLKILFPSLFKNLDIRQFHYDVCEFAKHICAIFPASNNRCHTPFELIHSDIWGPSLIPNVSGARWFVSFIDDCTRLTWVFLLKSKYDVSDILPNFFSMIHNQFRIQIKRFRSNNVGDYFNQTLSTHFL